MWRIDRSISLFIHDSPLEAAGTSPLFSQPFLLSFIHFFFLSLISAWDDDTFFLSFFFEYVWPTGRDPTKANQDHPRDRREKSVMWCRFLSFLPMVQIFSRLSFSFLHSKWVPHSCNCLSLSVQSPLCKSLEVPLSIRQTVSLSLFWLSGETGKQSHFLVLKQTKHNEIVLKNNKNKKNNG